MCDLCHLCKCKESCENWLKMLYDEKRQKEEAKYREKLWKQIEKLYQNKNS